MPASISTRAGTVVRLYARILVIVVCSVPMAASHARQNRQNSTQVDAMMGSRFIPLFSGIVSSVASVVCMASMGAMAAASTAGAMAGMAAAVTPTSPVFPLTHVLQSVGLGGLTHVSHAIVQPLFIALLLTTIAAATYRAFIVRSSQAISLALLISVAAVGLYSSIYIVVSEMVYWTALFVLILTSLLTAWSGRRRGMVHDT